MNITRAFKCEDSWKKRFKIRITIGLHDPPVNSNSQGMWFFSDLSITYSVQPHQVTQKIRLDMKGIWTVLFVTFEIEYDPIWFPERASEKLDCRVYATMEGVLCGMM